MFMFDTSCLCPFIHSFFLSFQHFFLVVVVFVFSLPSNVMTICQLAFNHNHLAKLKQLHSVGLVSWASHWMDWTLKIAMRILFICLSQSVSYSLDISVQIFFWHHLSRLDSAWLGVPAHLFLRVRIDQSPDALAKILRPPYIYWP